MRLLPLRGPLLAAALLYSTVLAAPTIVGEEKDEIAEEKADEAPPFSEPIVIDPDHTSMDEIHDHPPPPGPIVPPEKGPFPGRPAYHTLRYTEDWSSLASLPPEAPKDFFDPVKYIPIVEGSGFYASFGGEARSRLEAWSKYAFEGPGDRDDIFWLNRLRYHVDIQSQEFVRRVFIEGKNAFSTDRDLPGGRRPQDVDELDLQNAFVDFVLPLPDYTTMITIRPGRQELLFGRGRLIGPHDWTNSRRTFDAVSGMVEVFDWNVTGFVGKLVKIEKYHFDEMDNDVVVYGAYVAGEIPGPSIGVDAYFIATDRDASALGDGFNGTTGDEERYAPGLRFYGDVGDTGLDYDVEAAYQFGEIGTVDVEASMVASEIGYTFKALESAPRLHLGFDFASGDDSPGGDVQTFYQMFPDSHPYLGAIDTVARQNIVAFSLGAQLRLLERLTTAIEGYYFLRADTEDGLYDAEGNLVRGPRNSKSEVGSEIDVTIRYDFDRHLTAEFGYGHFFVGDFLDEQGSDSDTDFAYLMLSYRF